ncbi:hypothetical protein [Vibrio crassostreae]|uniref:hypothetical protein n=1 Tax=Vibrio crassostreae TaxID=246167 RepID=UPI001B311BA7|nr:hypothetical protein [Vibrio crassostreae]
MNIISFLAETYAKAANISVGKVKTITWDYADGKFKIRINAFSTTITKPVTIPTDELAEIITRRVREKEEKESRHSELFKIPEPVSSPCTDVMLMPVICSS